MAIDGAFFDGDASKASITTRKKLAERLAALDRDIEAYRCGADRERRRGGGATAAGATAGGEDVAQKVAALMDKRAQRASRSRAT